MDWRKWGVRAALAAGLVAMVLLPNWTSRFTVVLIYTLLVNIALAQSWNLVGGYTGLISLGHASFFGIGAYACAIAIDRLDLPFWIAIVAGGLLATIFAVIISFPTFRFRGVYFAIGTLILAEALRIWMINWEWTGGAQGMRFPMRGMPGRNELYYIMLCIAVVISRRVTA